MYRARSGICHNLAMDQRSPIASDQLGADTALLDRIRGWGDALGFQALGFTGVDLQQHEEYLQKWLAKGYHGEMEWMARHGSKRSQPNALVPGTCTVITARMDYLPEGADAEQVLSQSELAYISRYALGRDYHKLMRARLAKLARQIETQLGTGRYRAFVDSAPVLERALAENAGLGWIGKNTMLLNDKAGSWFFLGEIYTDIPLPPDPPQATQHCGTCQACLDICPTQAFVAPWVLDARKCISYLTIEFDGVIPEALRRAMGNRIYGCDDCQLVCPWNKFAAQTREPDFAPRHQLDSISLATCFGWDEATFLARTEGSAIRRIGYSQWRRNVAIALGNADTSDAVVRALQSAVDDPSAVVREHVLWALAQHTQR
ncbi:tRNA epoxyqueuosine(34) reductase QueG [Luminiphilus sp.]|nr:tRNA epoxyqueuosine(34) reductase QueG [Luminiphilus sp.]